MGNLHRTCRFLIVSRKLAIVNELPDRERWDARYRERSSLWSGKPNATLIAETGGLRPGTALEVAAGEGADAIWLSQQGWTVTGVDFSPVGLERAAAHAREAGVQITWLCEDVLEWQPPRRAYDLVTVHFLHLPQPQRRQVYGALAAAVAVGGSLLVVAHHPSDLQTRVARPPFPERFFTGDDLVADIGAADTGAAGTGAAGTGASDWEIVTNVAAPREATDVDGNSATVHDTILRAQYLPRGRSAPSRTP